MHLCDRRPVTFVRLTSVEKFTAKVTIKRGKTAFIYVTGRKCVDR